MPNLLSTSNLSPKLSYKASSNRLESHRYSTLNHYSISTYSLSQVSTIHTLSNPSPNEDSNTQTHLPTLFQYIHLLYMAQMTHCQIISNLLKQLAQELPTMNFSYPSPPLSSSNHSNHTSNQVYDSINQITITPSKLDYPKMLNKHLTPQPTHNFSTQHHNKLSQISSNLHPMPPMTQMESSSSIKHQLNLKHLFQWVYDAYCYSLPKVQDSSLDQLSYSNQL